MGQPKLVLPWGNNTVIQHVVGVLSAAGIAEVIVVTGGAGPAVKTVLADTPVKIVDNPDYQISEMTTSLQAGIRALSEDCRALLVVLGDQPTIQPQTVQAVITAFTANSAVRLVVPSYQMHRGHPWLVERSLWSELQGMRAKETMRDFLHRHDAEIQYVDVDDAGILKDLDTPEDYDQLRSAAN